MTFEEAKQLLKDYKGIKKRLKSEQAKIVELRLSLTSVKVTDYGKSRVKGGQASAYVDAILDRIEKIETRCTEMMNKLFEIEDVISESIDSLSPLEQSMIIDRYIHGYSWKRICREHHYCERQVRRKVDESLKKISKK